VRTHHVLYVQRFSPQFSCIFLVCLHVPIAIVRAYRYGIYPQNNEPYRSSPCIISLQGPPIRTAGAAVAYHKPSFIRRHFVIYRLALLNSSCTYLYIPVVYIQHNYNMTFDRVFYRRPVAVQYLYYSRVSITRKPIIARFQKNG